MAPLDRNAKIYIAGHRGLAGSAIWRALGGAGFRHLLARDHKELDLTEQSAVRAFFEKEKPEYVVMAAAKVGGILANAQYPGEFLYENLMIEANVIEACRRNGVRKVIFLGSTCVYPKLAPQPIREQDLLSGPLEPTNEAYAIAKITGLKLCEAYGRQYGLNAISLMPTNLYGPNDNFDPETSHVLPALIARAHRAKTEGSSELVVWGTGTPLREFLHADDLAAATVFCLENVDGISMLNVGSGVEISIHDLAQLICTKVGFEGSIRFDGSKPDGTPRKLCDTSRISALGWKPKIELIDGIGSTYDWYRQNLAS